MVSVEVEILTQVAKRLNISNEDLMMIMVQGQYAKATATIACVSVAVVVIVVTIAISELLYRRGKLSDDTFIALAGLVIVLTLAILAFAWQTIVALLAPKYAALIDLLEKIGGRCLMLIGFSGPSGSGKTTLVNMVAERLRQKGYDVGVVQEVAREVFRKYQKYGFSSLDEIRNSPHILSFQWDVFLKQIAAEDYELERHDIVLTDRTIYDILFYTLFWRPRTDDEDYSKLEAYIGGFDFADNSGRRYKLIFLCEPVNGPVDDGFRTPDLRYRRVQFEVIKRLLPHYHFLPALEPEKRAELAVFVIEEMIT